MAKELPFFKFESQEWDTGNIQMCSRQSKGLFIDLCSLYWSRLGELPYALALQKLCNGIDDAFGELKKHEIFGVVDDHIVIDFLDEQLLERNLVSEERRKAAKKRWSDANALQLESKSNARREEEKREENKKEEKKPARAYEVPFVDNVLASWNEWEQYRKERNKKLTPSTAKKQFKFLGGRAENEIIGIINQSIEKGWEGLFELKQENNGNRSANQGTNGSTTTIINNGKDFGIKKGFSRS